MRNGVEIRYKCKCMSCEANLSVPFRRRGEDIVEWMETCVQRAIYLDHRQRSPLCLATALEYAKIPAPDSAPFIGGKPELN